MNINDRLIERTTLESKTVESTQSIFPIREKKKRIEEDKEVQEE